MKDLTEITIMDEYSDEFRQIEAGLRKLMEYEESRTERLISEAMHSGRIIPTIQEMKRIHHDHLRRIEPFAAELTKLYQLSSPRYIMVTP